MSAVLYWVRPWFPGALVHNLPVFEGHISPKCERLMESRPDPVEGAGWLDTRDGACCSECLYAYDPKLHATLHADEYEDDDE